MRLNIAVCLVFLLPCIVYCAGSEHLANPDNIDARVVGGVSSRSIYQVSLQVKVRRRVGEDAEEEQKGGKQAVLEHFCGASFVNRHFVVTAAHCVENVKRRKVRVVGGRRRWADSKRREVFEIKRIIIHDNYTKNTLDADIALIELAQPVVFYNKMQKVELPEQGYIVEDKKRVILTGFGKENETDESFADDLQKAKLKVINHEKCRKKYKKVDKEVTDNMLCAAGDGKGPCHGDDGGPLMQQGTLVGITSWYHGCATDAYPSVYVQVSNFVDWINAVLKA